MALWARFQNLRGGGLTIRGAEFSEGAGFLKDTMFFCKNVVFVATLLILIFLI